MSTSKIDTVRIQVRQGYDVHIGPHLLAESGKICARLGMKKAVIVTDSTVAALHLPALEQSLAKAGIESDSFVFPAGEKSKNMRTLSDVLEFLADRQLTRADFVIALGGGVTGDMAGFAGACYLRGVRYVQVPTTLLAAVDSSVGGKTAVDLAHGKNLAGAFKQPETVICDTDCIATLPAEIFSDGAAEVIKTAVLSDESLFALCENGGVRENLQQVIRRCVAYKGRVVAEDEFEKSIRKLLNLGHTVGHAIEKCSGYSIPHGRAVASGMGIIARFAARNGLCTAETCHRIENALTSVGLPTGTEFGAEELYNAALADKKRAGGEITLILPRAIGNCELVKVPVEQMLPIIASGLEEL